MSRAKCLSCGAQPLIQQSCAACGKTGRRAPAPRRAAPPRAPSVTADWAAGIASYAPSAPPPAHAPYLSAPPPAYGSPLAALQAVWGYSDFRPGQREIIDAVLGGENLVVIAPTSFGKSICFQLPAVVRPDRPVLVVSPLIALMADQVQQARGRGIHALSLTSHLSRAEMEAALASLPYARIIYAAPERLDNMEFRRALAVNPPWLVALDEAHSIGGEAGLSYRPAYRFVAEMVAQSGRATQWLALTASATRDTVADMKQRLQLPEARLIRLSCSRPNLAYRVEMVRAHDKLARTARLVRDAVKQGAAIVYTLSRKDAEEVVAPLLRQVGVNALHYHAGLPASERRRVEHAFFSREVPVVVSTCAFGMGVDRPDVRLVVMHGMPKSVEDFYQSMGRAGRDGQPARCVALFDAVADVRLRTFLASKDNKLDQNQWTAQHGWQDPRFKDATALQLKLLGECTRFLNARRCREQMLRQYFDELPGDPCGRCDVCAPSDLD